MTYVSYRATTPPPKWSYFKEKENLIASPFLQEKIQFLYAAQKAPHNLVPNGLVMFEASGSTLFGCWFSSSKMVSYWRLYVVEPTQGLHPQLLLLPGPASSDTFSTPHLFPTYPTSLPLSYSLLPFFHEPLSFLGYRIRAPSRGSPNYPILIHSFIYSTNHY